MVQTTGLKPRLPQIKTLLFNPNTHGTGGDGEDLGNAERLREVAADAQVNRFDGAGFARVRGDDDDGQRTSRW